jgi:nicotinate-nucleotide pyrophosphorylase (carboxylating)
MTDLSIPGFDLAAFVKATLEEDLGLGFPGGGHDVTSESVIPAQARFAGVMDSRDPISVCGLPIAAAFFRALDPAMEIEILVPEGARVEPGTALMRLTGNARAMLTAERAALNTVQHLSGVATLTRTYVDAMGQTKARLLDTRKTIPGFRHLEKYAVRMGGGHNHRMGLWDAAMIKDNHVLVAGGVGPAVARALAAGVRDVICEVDTLDQIEPACKQAPPASCSTTWARHPARSHRPGRRPRPLRSLGRRQPPDHRRHRRHRRGLRLGRPPDPKRPGSGYRPRFHPALKKD